MELKNLENINPIINNVRYYYTKEVLKLNHENNIKLIDWLPYSWDINLIKMFGQSWKSSLNERKLYLFRDPEIAFYGEFLGTQRDFAKAIFLLTPRKSPWKAILGSRKRYNNNDEFEEWIVLLGDFRSCNDWKIRASI